MADSHPVTHLSDEPAADYDNKEFEPRMLRAVLFDFANTLVSFGKIRPLTLFPVAAKDTYQYLRGRKHSVPEFQEYATTHFRAFRRRYIWSAIRQRDFDAMDMVAGVLEKFDIHIPAAERRALAWLWYRPVLRQTHVEPGTLEMLRELRGRGLKLAIVSNTCAPGICLDRHLAEEHLLEFFPTRIYSSNTIYRKPHPHIFRAALHEMGVSPDQAIFVGDLIRADIKGGRRMGMTTVWKPASAAKNPAKRHQPDHIIRKITDLPRVIDGLMEIQPQS